MGNTVTLTLDDVLSKLDRVHRSGTGYKACCPAHDDADPSLSITEKDGKVLVYCHAGCDQHDVMSALGMGGTRKPPAPRAKKSPKTRAPKKLGTIVKTWDYTDANGKVLYQTVRYEPKDFRQRRPAPDNPSEYLMDLRGITPVLYRLPEVIEAVKSGQTILVCEGEKDADTAVTLGYVATTNPMGAKKWYDSYSQTLQGADIVILPDQDTIGKAHGATVAAAILSAGCMVRVVHLPAKDLTAWVEAGGTAADLAPLLDVEPLAGGDEKTAVKLQARVEEGQPSLNGTQGTPGVEDLQGVFKTEEGTHYVEIRGKLTAYTDEGIAALATLPESVRLYQHDGFLVQLTTKQRAPRTIRQPEDTPLLAEVQAARIRDLASLSALWWRYDARLKKNVEKEPPRQFAETVLGRPSWPWAPPIKAVVSAPTMRPDGSILETHGYDEATGLYFWDNGTHYPPVKDVPSMDDVQDALKVMLEVTQDFPFIDVASHTAAWAGILTLCARHAIEGNVPCFAVRATTAGTGKGKLVDAISLAALGQIPAKYAQTDEEEDRKALMAVALQGTPILCIDNVNYPLGSPALEVALTTSTITSRMLGQNKTMLTADWVAVLFATGNNMRFKGDMIRRVVPITLDAGEEKPEERTDFVHAPLEDWVREEHPRLVTAALTLLRAYYVDGTPPQGLSEFGSFEPWSDLVRSALVWAGEADPCEGRRALAQESDSTYAALSALLTNWRECFPLCENGNTTGVPRTLRQVNREINDALLLPHPQDHWQGLYDALDEFDSRPNGKTLGLRSIGKSLLSMEGRVLAGHCIRREPGNTQGAKWYCQRVEGSTKKVGL